MEGLPVMATPSFNRAALDAALLKLKVRARRKAIAPGLYHLDLDGSLSKYIGETAQNLRGLFVSVERAGALLLLDEADALFGKRSEVKDSHDRYAAQAVSHLLARFEGDRWPPRLR
jgi:hypothetical protein